jgi:hypothetical protein
MSARLCVAALAAVLAVGIVNAAAAEKNPLLGKWTVSSAEVAPWIDETTAVSLGAQAKKQVGLTILFTSRTILSRERTLRCRNPSYELTTFPADALFQSALPEPDQVKLAATMGFPPGRPVAGVDVNCSAGLFSYHVRPDGRMMFAYNNIIYTLSKR